MAIVTISRGSLSGGRALAECLAERLGCPCLAEEILDEAAGKIGVPVEVTKAKFQTTPGLWSRLVRDRELYRLAVQTALAEACLEGSLVYHGLAGQFLLEGLPGVFKVRLVAPLPMRIHALVRERHRMTREAAEAFIRNVDQDRARWVRISYDSDVEDPGLYDLTVNLRVLSLDTACASIAAAVSTPEFETTPGVRAAWEAFAAERRDRLDALMGAR